MCLCHQVSDSLLAKRKGNIDFMMRQITDNWRAVVMVKSQRLDITQSSAMVKQWLKDWDWSTSFMLQEASKN